MTSAPASREPGDGALLILEPGSDGHQREWLEHLVRHARRDASQPVVVLVAPELQAGLDDEAGEGVLVRALTPFEHRACTHRRPAVSGFARWWVMRRHLHRLGAARGHFLELDHLSLPLALGLGFGGRKVEGVLFRPSVHYADLGPYAPDAKERLRDRLKDLLYRWMLRNPAVDRVLSLDSYFPRHAERRYRHGAKVEVLRDPAHPLVHPGPGDAALTRSVPPSRVLLSLFGYLTARKGVLQTLDALALLSPLRRARLALVLAGRIDPAIAPDIDRRVAALRRDAPELWLRVEDRRLGDGELSALVLGSDAVLAPYQRFVGSSGVLLWAAAAGKPVLTQEAGLIGRLVSDHGLGLAVDTSDPQAIAEAIDHLVIAGASSFVDPIGARLFVDQCTPGAFAARVLNRGDATRTPLAQAAE